MPRHQQQERVDVAAPFAARPPVQARRPARPVTGGDRSQCGAGGDRRPLRDQRRDGFVSGAQPVGVLHRHHTATGEHPGEHHGARCGGEHRGARGGGEVDAPVAGAEAVRRLPERHLDRRVRPQRPAVGRGAPVGVRWAGARTRGARRAGPARRRNRSEQGPGPGRGRCTRGRHEQQRDQRDEQPSRGLRGAHRPPSSASCPRLPAACRPDPVHASTVGGRCPQRKPRSRGCGCPPSMWTTGAQAGVRRKTDGVPGVC